MKMLLAENHRKLILASLPTSGTMLEWGCGGSTKWFLDHLTEGQRLITIEHDSAWAEECRSYCGQRENWALQIKPSTLAVGKNASHWEECSAGLAEYIAPISHWSDIDVFLIDGVARGACLAMVHAHGKPGAGVFLHDLNRPGWYEWAMGLPRFTDRHLIEADNGEYPPPLWQARIA